MRFFHEPDLGYTEPVFGGADPYRRQIEGFARAILTGRHAAPTADDGIQAMRVIDAVRAASARSALPS